MTDGFTLADFADLLVEVCGMPAEYASRVTAESEVAELGLDSTFFLALQLELEERLGLDFSDAGLHTFGSVGDILAYVNHCSREVKPDDAAGHVD